MVRPRKPITDPTLKTWITEFSNKNTKRQYCSALRLFKKNLGIEDLSQYLKSEPDTEGSSIVPLAFPLIAGPGSLTTIISFNSLYPFWTILIGIVLNLIVVYITLKYSEKLSKLLGKSGMMILRKVFGIICLAIAIKMIKFNLFL